ncbi:inositol monophosphatase family protein [Paracoccus pantotrophus]|uniref:inositol monophosphatase family protein n=1 Tax=Paracoccus pantotrophus TaxID=82367 RepID=UPI0008ED6F42|nr:inositol monophosphatase family protein [Paracoccus pantotrophus]MDF3855762.1 inositol monophosphatase family protein [Paracoccus pantotrophus]SFP19805.1 Inositol monophosphatase family protein [Paracoccus pantotrophus]
MVKLGRLNLVAFVTRKTGLAFRYYGCGSVSLLGLALGHVDGYISLAESSWDVMAALAILGELGTETTVDWRSVGLTEKAPLACGTPDFIEAASKFRA